MKLLCAGAFLLLLAGSAAAKPGIAASTVNLRAEANTTSEILGKIQGGSRIDVGDCANNWCAVTWNGKQGFAIATALDTTGRPRVLRRGPPRGYDPDDEYIPVRRPYPYPYPPGYVVGPRIYGPGPYVYGPGPYWGGYWGPRWGYGWRRW